MTDRQIEQTISRTGKKLFFPDWSVRGHASYNLRSSTAAHLAGARFFTGEGNVRTNYQAPKETVYCSCWIAAWEVLTDCLLFWVQGRLHISLLLLLFLFLISMRCLVRPYFSLDLVLSIGSHSSLIVVLSSSCLSPQSSRHEIVCKGVLTLPVRGKTQDFQSNVSRESCYSIKL